MSSEGQTSSPNQDDERRKEKKAELKRIKTKKIEEKIQAWEEQEMAKITNRAERRLAQNEANLKGKRLIFEAQHRQIEEEAEKLKWQEREKVKNEEAKAEKEAADEKARIEAERQNSIIALKEKSTKYLATNTPPSSSKFCPFK